MKTLLKNINLLLIIIGITFTTILKTYGQDKNLPKDLYIASAIPDSLKTDANSVVRYSDDEVVVKAPGEATIKHHHIITILNEKGDKDGYVIFPYNRKFDSYNSILIQVYDADGKLVKKYHKSDMYDGAAMEDFEMLSDERFLGLRHVISTYPMTIESESEEDVRSYINLDPWNIQRLEQAVQHSSYKVSVKPEMGFKYLYKNIKLNPLKVSSDGIDIYVWQVSNLKAVKPEDGSEMWSILPSMAFSTNTFNCFGYPGSMDSWQDYGKWVYGLNKDVCTLSPARVAEIKQMTDTIKSDKKKAMFLYKYLQQNTRYVAITLGIGGYKPFDANFVDQKKYGDCKALANYMYALLKAVGIPSYWAVVRAGENEYAADPAFPNSCFNHEILCVPFKNDTTWLDCTMTTRPFGQPGPFTEDRNALLITEDGGKLVNTPKSTPVENQFNSEVHLAIDSDGSAKAEVKIMTTGEYREEYIAMSYWKEDERKDKLLTDLQIKQPSVFNVQYGKDKEGVKEMDLHLEYDKYCDIAVADKQFYKPHVFSLWGMTIPAVDKRKSNYYFDFPRQKTCVTTIDLPKGFEVETLPANQTLKFSYGNYDVNYIYDATKNQIISTAKFNLNNHVIPAAKYNELQQYLDAVAKAQNKKLVIRKKA